ncbi:MAG: RNA polymerase sigma factor [Actinomycetota bacterium]
MLDAARAGDPRAWRRLVDDLGGDIIGYARSRGIPDAEDLAGDVFEVLARRIGSFQGDQRAFRSFAFTVAHHRIADHFRSASQQRERPPAPYLAAAESAKGEHEAETVGALDALATIVQLPPDQRDSMLLHVFGQLDLVEVAQVLGKEPDAVRQLQRRARRRLRTETTGRVTP